MLDTGRGPTEGAVQPPDTLRACIARMQLSEPQMSRSLKSIAWPYMGCENNRAKKAIEIALAPKLKFAILERGRTFVEDRVAERTLERYRMGGHIESRRSMILILVEM